MTNKESVGKFVIVKDLQFSDFMKNEKRERLMFTIRMTKQCLCAECMNLKMF